MIAERELIETATATPTERLLLALVGTLLQRIDDLSRRVDDLEHWVGEVADDTLDLAGCPDLAD